MTRSPMASSASKRPYKPNVWETHWSMWFSERHKEQISPEKLQPLQYTPLLQYLGQFSLQPQETLKWVSAFGLNNNLIIINKCKNLQFEHNANGNWSEVEKA